MNNSELIADFLKVSGVTQKKLYTLLGVCRKTLYSMINKPTEGAFSDSRKIKLNSIFKKYSYAGEIK